MSTRTKILKAASQLFLDGGASSLSVRAISKEAGLSTIGIYSHFKGKQGILDALYIEGFNLVRDATDVASDTGSARERVLKAVKRYIQVGQEHEAHYRFIFGETFSSYKPSDEAIKARDIAFGKLVEAAKLFLSETIDEPNLSDCRKLAMDIWSMVHGYISINHHTEFKGDVKWNWQKAALNAVSLKLDSI